MANKQGDFIWYELMTSDLGAAQEFYGALLGWSGREAGPDTGGYQLFSEGTTDVAGGMALPYPGARPAWLGYIAVEDVDASVAKIVAAGGVQHVPPTDIPGVGRFAMLADPQGAMFYIMRGAMEGESQAFDSARPGRCNWNELTTTDVAKALDFYLQQFGWERGDAMPMGEMGDYQFINHGGQMIGAMMRQPPGGPPPMWLFYFGVNDIDSASSTVKDKGGTVHHGPAEIPGGSFIIVASDGQGAMFGAVGPRK